MKSKEKIKDKIQNTATGLVVSLATNEGLAKKVSEIAGDLAAIKGENKYLLNKVEEQDKEIKSMKEEIVMFRKEIVILKEEIVMLKKENAILRNEIAILKRENKTHLRKVEILEKENSTMLTNILQHNMKVSKITTK